MKRMLGIVVAMCFSTWLSSDTVAQTLGIYFDSAGVNPSISTADLTFPCQMQAYVVAKGYDSTDGVEGWECQLSWSSSLFVSVASIAGQGINVTAFPDFMVGCPSPIGVGSESVALAVINVVALGSGELFLKARTPCSIPASQLPVLAVGGTLVPATYEFGGPDSPCASVGGAVVPQPSSASIELVSQYSRMEFRDGELYGYKNAEKTWVRMQGFALGEDVVLSDEQLKALSLVPRLQPSSAMQTREKAMTLLSEDFEGYYPTSSTPFYQKPGYSQKFFSWPSSNPADDGARVLWGVTDSRASSGNNSAYCNDIWKYCTSWTPPTNCASYNAPQGTYPNGISSSMNATQQLNLANGQTRFRCKLWSDIGGWEYEMQQYDYLLIFVQNPAGYWPIASVWYNTDWALVDEILPTGFGDQTDLFFAFFSDGFDGSNAGVYIDDVTIEAFDNDISIDYILWDGAATQMNLPNICDVTIRNTGTMSTGDFSIAYSRGTFFDATALEGYQVVPSIDANSTRTVRVAIPFPETKTFNQDINQTAHFLVDARNEVLEGSDETNNTASCTIRWTLPNPPVILVHGILGGALTKKGMVGTTPIEKQVYGSDILTDIESFVLKPEMLRRRDDTNGEETQQAFMYTPSAYQPEYGFLRGYQVPAPLVYTPNPSPLGALIHVPGATVPIVSDLWKPLLDNLTSTASGEGFVLPGSDPSGDPYHTQDVFLFNYDWRLDLSPDRNVALNGSNSAYARMDSLITWIKDHHLGKDRLTVVSHSMGGLLVEAYLKSRPTTHGISRWISLGTPFQGSESAMATLAGHTDGVQSVAGLLASRWAPDMFQEFPSLWAMLPTAKFDAEARVDNTYWWGSSEPFWCDLTPNHCGAPCRRVNFPLDADYYVSMDQWKQHPSWYGTWYHNNAARQFGNQMQSLYMNSSTASRISGVDTWLLVGKTNKYSTLRGIARYGMQPGPVDPEVPTPYRFVCHELVRGPGDGVVSPWSGTTVNVDEQNTHIRYVAGVDHMGLLQNMAVGNFVGDLIRGRSLSNYWDIETTEPAGPDVAEPWYIRWHTDAATLGNKDGEKVSQFAGMPVSLELVQIDPINAQNNKVVVGFVHSQSHIGDAGAPQNICVALDPRFSVSEIGDDLIIASSSPELLHMRLYIRPNPALWEPAMSLPTNTDLDKTISDFKILGHVYLRDLDHTFAFPSEEYPDTPYVKFTGVGTQNYGFGGYMDFTIQNGNIPIGVELTLYVDGNGDGSPDMEVSGTPDSGELPPLQADTVTCSPNPFNGGTFIEWALTEGTASAIEVFDVGGRRVLAKRVDGTSRGRTHFDGTGDDGRSLPSGVYLVLVKDERSIPRARTTITVLK